MKLKFVILLFVCLLPQLVFASVCSTNGFTVLTINGINTDLTGAKSNSFALAYKIGNQYNNQPLTVDYLYNPTHGIIVDLLDSANQKYFDQNSFDIEDSDYAQMIADASEKVTTQKVLLVAHSQGNFYANTIYDALADEPGGVPSRSIGVYSVATPANRVAGDGLYLTSDTDNVIAGVVSHSPLAQILKPNIHIDFKDSDDGGQGHDFSKIYLAYQGNKIASDIKNSLDKLKSNDEQDGEDPCISPPELTLTQKIQGKMFAIIDPVSVPVQNAIFAIGEGIFNTGLAIANKVAGLVASPVVTLQKDAAGLAMVSPDAVDSMGATTSSSPVINSTQEKTSTVSTKTTPSSAQKTKVVTASDSDNKNEVQGNNVSLAIEQATPSASQGSHLNTVSVKQSSNLISQTETSSGNTSTNDNNSGTQNPTDPTTPTTPTTSPSGENTSTPPAAPADVTPPVITLLGNNPETIVAGSNYVDAGATALDNVDGVVDVASSGVVDSLTVGTYTVTYTAKDSSGNVATATRTVNVVVPPPLPPISLKTTTIDKDTTLYAGEYNYDNLVITNNATLTLAGDPIIPDSFKGVKINAINITVDPGASISADGKGYDSNSGPGASTEGSVGASYGGLGLGAGDYSKTYGSATKPMDLGSGGNYPGGGAIYLNVSGSFTDNGIVSADGNTTGSGGSIYVTANNIAGNGKMHANGGGMYANGYFKSPGGGGRIALHYYVSEFSGTTEVKGGCGSYDGWSMSCGQNGTVGLFDESTNNLYLNGPTWKFLQADAPFSYNDIYISNGAQVTSEDGVTVNAKNLTVDKNSSFILADNQVLNIPQIAVDGGSTLTLSGSEKITANSLTVDGINSMVTVIPEKILSLNIPNITVNAGAFISVDAKGYDSNSGPGASTEGSVGASYGGLSLGGGDYSKTYGSATNPTDLGSGGAYSGGGAIKLIVSGTLKNDGTITAIGGASGSGGSINIKVNNITGAGKITADGGSIYGNGYFKSPGGGGRVALYYQTSSFSGQTEAKGGCGSYDGWSMSCGQSGTVGLIDESKNDLYVNGNAWEFFQTDEPFSFNNIYVSGGAQISAENGVILNAKNLSVDKNSSITLADGDVLNIPTITIDGGSTLTLSGSETFNSNSLVVSGNSTVTIPSQKILSLNIPNININFGSYINADAKGYGANQGPGAPTNSAGASYGGVGYGNSATSTYGSLADPTDFGSGGAQSGGGAIKINVSGTLKNDGIISASGGASGSGGSIIVTANNLTGSGSINADGGALYGNGYFQGPGGGGRLAISYMSSSFSGTIEAKGGCGSYDGWSKTCAGDGTVNIVDESVTPPPPAPVTPPDSPTTPAEPTDPTPTQSTLKAISTFNFVGLTPNVLGTVDETNHAISLTVPFGTDVTALVPTIVISDKASVSPNNNVAQNFTSPTTYTVTAEDSSTQNYVVTVSVASDPNPPVVPDATVTQLKIITSPQTISAGNPSSVVTIESEDASGSLAKVASTTHVILSSNSATGTFASASASKNSCDTDWTKTGITISKGDAHESFCYEDSTPGTPTITVSDSIDGISSDSQIFTVN